ncbi:hypothetical protein AGMMS50230_00290 [Spirochaetia bacterium]|nr:hypothetical protein AGMMS50230_00290 [Spirochaetia bacterium]
MMIVKMFVKRSIVMSIFLLLVTFLFTSCNTPIKEDIDFNLTVKLVSNWNELKQAVEHSTAEIIALAKSFETPNSVTPGAITVSRTVTLTVYSGTETISRQTDFKTNFFQVQNGGHLTLGHPKGGTLILDGKNISTPSTPGSHFVKLTHLGATCTLADGAILRNNNGHGAVEISATGYGGTFIMTGGEISSNTASGYAGGVYIGGNGVFIMTGGTIHGNKSGVGSGAGGGVVVQYGGSFTMRGGSISGNIVDGGVGGGVYVDSNGPFIKTGGIIYGSDGGDMSNKFISAGDGDAVFVNVTPPSHRNNTAGEDVILDSTKPGTPGGWE